MREILFRGKRIDNGEWIEGAFAKKCDPLIGAVSYFIVRQELTSVGNLDSFFTWHRVNPTTIGQYTGLKDKTGKMIFEGDIIQYGSEPACVCFGEYAFDHEMKTHVGIYLEWINKTYYRIDFGYWANEREIEVVGNIHDNPELK